MKLTRARVSHFSSRAAVVHSPSRVSLALERESIMVAGTRWIYKDCLSPGKAGELAEVSISGIYGRLCHRCSSQTVVKETFSTSASTREFLRQLYARHKSLLSIFYAVRPGRLFRARVRKLVAPALFLFHYPHRKNPGEPPLALNHRRCALKLDEFIKLKSTKCAYFTIHRLHEDKNKLIVLIYNP